MNLRPFRPALCLAATLAVSSPALAAEPNTAPQSPAQPAAEQPRATPAFSFSGAAGGQPQQAAPSDATVDLSFQASGAAVEAALMSGLFDTELSGGLLVGYKTGGLTIGAGMNFASKSDSIGDDAEASSSTFAIGPELRFAIARSSNERAELYGQIDLGLAIATQSERAGEARKEATLAGIFFRAGPGVRYWLHQNVALGYVATLQGVLVSGDTETRAAGQLLGTVDSTHTVLKLGGALQLLAVF